jgi:hypothetical protein
MTEPRCLSVAPIMPSTDIARTAAFYARLGFAMGDPDGDFLMMRRDDIELFFGLNPEHDPKRTAACIYVRVSDSDALNALWHGIQGVKQPVDQDYGQRDLPVIDPDGNMLLFGSPLRGHAAS